MHVSRGGRRCDESCDGTRAEADHTPSSLDAVVEKTPDHSAERGCKHGVPDGKDSPEVCTESTATVEAEPSEPQHEC